MFVIEVVYFVESSLIHFEEPFPFWDLFLCQVAQVYPSTFDEDIVGKMIFLWIDEDNEERVVSDDDALQFALESFDKMQKNPKFRIWFLKLPYNLVTGSFVDLTT